MGHATMQQTEHYIKYAERVQGQAYDAFLPGAEAPSTNVNGLGAKIS